MLCQVHNQAQALVLTLQVLQTITGRLSWWHCSVEWTPTCASLNRLNQMYTLSISKQAVVCRQEHTLHLVPVCQIATQSSVGACTHCLFDVAVNLATNSEHCIWRSAEESQLRSVSQDLPCVNICAGCLCAALVRQLVPCSGVNSQQHFTNDA